MHLCFGLSPYEDSWEPCASHGINNADLRYIPIMATDLNGLLRQSRGLKEMLRKLTEKADKLQKEIADARERENEPDPRNKIIRKR